jgi:hypothetical protein
MQVSYNTTQNAIVGSHVKINFPKFLHYSDAEEIKIALMTGNLFIHIEDDITFTLASLDKNTMSFKVSFSDYTFDHLLSTTSFFDCLDKYVEVMKLDDEDYEEEDYDEVEEDEYDSEAEMFECEDDEE